MPRFFRPKEASQPAKQADQRDGVNDALHLDCVGVGVQAWQPDSSQKETLYAVKPQKWVLPGSTDEQEIYQREQDAPHVTNPAGADFSEG